MNYSRRDLAFLPLLAAAAGRGASAATLPSKTYRFEDLKVRDNGQNRARQVLDGETHNGVNVELHMTELEPGKAPHAPHHHVHEEMIMIHEGTMEVTISGKSTRLGPGSTAYVASNEEHGWKNVGDTRALYFVLAIGKEKK